MWLLFLTAWLFRSLIFLPRRYTRSFIFISTNQLRALCNRTEWESESYKKSYAAVRYKFVYLLDVKRDLRTSKREIHKNLFSAPTAHPERKAGRAEKSIFLALSSSHAYKHDNVQTLAMEWLHRPWLSTLLSSKIHRYQNSQACARCWKHNVKAYSTHFIQKGFALVMIEKSINMICWILWVNMENFSPHLLSRG